MGGSCDLPIEGRDDAAADPLDDLGHYGVAEGSESSADQSSGRPINHSEIWGCGRPLHLRDIEGGATASSRAVGVTVDFWSCLRGVGHQPDTGAVVRRAEV